MPAKSQNCRCHSDKDAQKHSIANFMRGDSIQQHRRGHHQRKKQIHCKPSAVFPEIYTKINHSNPPCPRRLPYAVANPFLGLYKVRKPCALELLPQTVHIY